MNNYDSNAAHIVYASDDRFASIMGVSLVSLYDNSRDMDEIKVYILDGGIKRENRRKLEEVSKSYGRPIPIWAAAKDICRELSMDVAADRGSVSQYARLFLSSSLPSELTRILYLDCDTIFFQSVRELWNLDIRNRTVGVLMDAFSKYYRANINLKADDVMFNSGVMLIDLERWRMQNVEKKMMSFIRSKKGKIQQGDQGVLNAVLSEDAYCFEPRFNAVTIYFDFTYKEMMTYRKPPVYYSEQEIRRAVEEPVIVHYTTSFLSRRPWMEGSRHRYVNEWLKYKEISPWRKSELWLNDQPQWKQKCSEIYKKLPRHVAVKIAGVLQAYGRPMINMIVGIIKKNKGKMGYRTYRI